MKNKPMLSVERELLVTLCNLHAVGFEDIAPEIKELRALLDKPECDHEFELPVLSSMPEYCAKCHMDKPAAQHHGHAIPQWLRDHFSEIEDEAMRLGGCGVFTQMRTKVQAYFEMARRQGEPVAVVMPERKPQDLSRDDQPAADWFEEVGYNSALDDVARLNGVKP